MNMAVCQVPYSARNFTRVSFSKEHSGCVDQQMIYSLYERFPLVYQSHIYINIFRHLPSILFYLATIFCPKYGTSEAVVQGHENIQKILCTTRYYLYIINICKEQAVT